MLVAAGAIGFPEVEIEHGRQLLRRREGEQFAGIVKPPLDDQGMERLRRQLRDRLCEVMICRDSREDVTIAILGHGPAMIPALNRNKQS